MSYPLKVALADLLVRLHECYGQELWAEPPSRDLFQQAQHCKKVLEASVGYRNHEDALKWYDGLPPDRTWQSRWPVKLVTREEFRSHLRRAAAEGRTAERYRTRDFLKLLEEDETSTPEARLRELVRFLETPDYGREEG